MEDENEMYVKKRNGNTELLSFDKISKRLKSLWVQICWLNSHKENYAGGNHFLENLTALVIGTLQFNSKNSEKINQKIFNPKV